MIALSGQVRDVDNEGEILLLIVKGYKYGFAKEPFAKKLVIFIEANLSFSCQEENDLWS